ncbi:uncharacterized protein LOC135489236 isoform X2 [Lineus longissimus]|uniref:uncharacterized protein LOC135489236 isoform X2 n=1 Tax=Lineus longissimus TaxID=88925 RepID=UPI00315D4141
MAEVLTKKKPKGRGRGRAQSRATKPPLPPGLLAVELDSCSSYDELSQSDVDTYRSGSQRSSFSDSAPSNLLEKDATPDVPKSEEQFLDAEVDKISFGSMEMTSSPLVTGRKQQVDSPLAAKPESASVANGPAISLNMSTGITPLAENKSPLPDNLNGSFHDDDRASAELDLDEKMIIFIRVTQCVDPSNFSGQIGRDEDFQAFSELECAIERYCLDDDDVVKHDDDFGPQYYVLARQRKTKIWKRAFVMGVDREADEVDVYYIDYGMSEILQLADVIYPVPDNFLQFQQFNYVCALDAVKPLASVWISRAVTLFKELVFEKKLEVEVVPTQPLNITIYIGDERKSVADLLLEEEVAMPCVSPSLLLQSPEPTEGVSIASTLATPEQYSSMASPDTASKTLIPDVASQTVGAESAQLMNQEEFGTLDTDGDVMLRKQEFGTALGSDAIDVAYPYVGISPSVTFRESSFDADTPERKTSSRSKSSKKYASSVVESVSEFKTSDIKSDARCVDMRKSKSEASTNVSQTIPDQYVMNTPETPPNLVVGAKTEPRHVKGPNKAPPAFQFDQLFKASSKIVKPRIPSSPDTPEADDLWKADPDILFMFGKEALEERRMNSLGLIEEQTDDDVQQNINIVEKIRQGREGRIRKSSQQAASQRTSSPKCHSPASSRVTKMTASGHPQRDSSPRVDSPHRSRTGKKKNLDKVVKAFDGKQEGKVQSSDPDGQVANKKTGTKDGSIDETRDQDIVEFLCCLQQAVETSDWKVRELAFENTTKLVDDFKLDLSGVLSTTDLEQYMGSLLRRGVLETKGEFIMDLLNLLQNHDSFGSTFSFAMTNVMLEFVKVVTRGRTKHEKSEDFCEFLIKIIKASTKWVTSARTSVLDFTLKTLEKWLIYNKKKLLTHNTADLERLFLQCTVTVLTAVGHVIDDAYPEKVMWMMTELRERQLDHDKWNRKTRSNVLDLLLLQARGWDQGVKQNGRKDAANDRTGCHIGAQCDLLVDKSEDGLGAHEKRDGAKKTDSGTAENDSVVAARLKEEPAEYTLVKAMLYDLHLDHLYTNFVSWGITDSLIKSEDMHLGNYLVGCGFTIPLVSRMMEYLDRDMPAPHVEEERVEPHQSLGEIIKHLGLPSERMMARRHDRDHTLELTPANKETTQRQSEVAPTKTLDFGSKDSSPSLKEVAETLFKTDKEIRKLRASGSRDVEIDEYNISEYFKVPFSKADSGAGVVLADQKEFPPLADTDEAETLVEWDDDPPLKQLSFSDMLRKKVERDVIAKFSEPSQKTDSLPEGPTIQDWIEERLKDGSGVTELGKGTSLNAAAGEPCREERKYAESAKKSESKFEKVSEKISDDWFFVESEDEEEDENPVPNFAKPTLQESQPRAQSEPCEQSTRSRPSDSWKLKRYSQTSPISKDPCNNVIAREDSLGLNAISDLLESEARSDATEAVTMVRTQTESAKPEMASSSKKPSWWRVPSPPKEKGTPVAGKCDSESDVKNSARDTKTVQDKNKGNANSVKKPNERTSTGNSKVYSKKISSDSKKISSDSKKLDGPESVVDWMFTGSSSLKGRMGPVKERLTPAGESQDLKAADVNTRASTPDCWSDLSDSEVDDPPVMFEPKLDHDASEMNCPKIDKSASKSLVGDWKTTRENDDFSGGGARPKTVKMSGRHDVVDSGLRTRMNGKNTDRGRNERESDSQSLRKKLDVNDSCLKNQTGSERSSTLDAKLINNDSAKKSHDSFEYDFQYVPQLEEPEKCGAPANAMYVDDNYEIKPDTSERKFAFQDGDNLTDSDDEVMVIMDDVIHDRILEEKDRKRKLHEKYVRLPETDHSFQGFSLMKPRCCTCGAENHRTYDCPNFK